MQTAAILNNLPANDTTWPEAYAITLDHAADQFDAGDVLLFNTIEEPRRHDVVAVIDPDLNRTLGTLILPLPAGRWAELPHADGSVLTYKPFDRQPVMVAIADIVAVHRMDGIGEAGDLPGADDEAVPATLLPVDEYLLEIVESAYAPNRTGTAMVATFDAVAINGSPEGQRVPYTMILEGEGADNGQREFAALRRAVGVWTPIDTSELYFRPFKARVDMEMVDGVTVNTVHCIEPVEAQRDERGRFAGRAA